MPLVGSAGHVDHGKSTLIRAITGRDPDRWAEEKRRGLTIDLGFAWTTLPDGTEISFVDVPGHERFLKNMLAGIEAIDVALFVVAADEGWMPQSEEHLAVLDLLEVRRGVVALTKVDLVEPDLIEVAIVEIEERLIGTSLENVSIVPVSAISGTGMPELVDSIAGLLPGAAASDGRPRMWVDRSFPMAGAGTIATGTLLGAPLAIEEKVEIYPTGRVARVRGLQSHESSHRTIGPGRRVALNLGGIDHREVARGHMVGMPGHWRTSSRFTASITKARFVAELNLRGAYQLHIGSSAHGVRLTGAEGSHVMLNLDDPVPMAVGDRFILRDTGRRLVVAGGRVLDPSPGPTKQALAHSATIDPTDPPDLIAERLLAIRGGDETDRLVAQSGGGRPGHAVIVGGLAFDPVRFRELSDAAVAIVASDHETHPLRTGTPLATLAERLGIETRQAEIVVERTERLSRLGPVVAVSGHAPGLSADQEIAWQRARDRLGAGLAVPVESDLGLDQEVIGLKMRNGELVRVGPGLVFLPSQIDEIRDLIMRMDDDFTVARFRDVTGLSRKYVVPILEWSDREGLTVRRGDLRRLR